MRCLRLTAVLLLSACYRYTSAPVTTIAPGSHVRLGLLPTPDGQLARVLGSETTGLEGRVVSESDSAWTVSVASTLKRREPIPANRTIWAGEEVSIPRAAVSRVELRSLDRKKTTRLIVLGAVGTVVLARLVVLVGSIGSGDDGGGPIVIPP
jgi:hypothetical protein